MIGRRKLPHIFADLVHASRQDGQLRRTSLSGGVELVVRVVEGVVTLTIKRPRVPVGARELITFREQFQIPDDAEILTPPEQGQKQLHLLWYFVTLRWSLKGNHDATD